ncbi:MAG: hypothetical protein IPL70_06860 [Uliginosibacterium sp.]|nr:hypothetical protein [Uliginosibacterium sp.]
MKTITRISFTCDGLTTGKPKRRFKLNLGYDAKGSAETDILRADPKLVPLMVLPCTFAADAEYLYVGYMENGLDAKVRGEITVYSMVVGARWAGSCQAGSAASRATST